MDSLDALRTLQEELAEIEGNKPKNWWVEHRAELESCLRVHPVARLSELLGVKSVNLRAVCYRLGLSMEGPDNPRTTARLAAAPTPGAPSPSPPAPSPSPLAPLATQASGASAEASADYWRGRAEGMEEVIRLITREKDDHQQPPATRVRSEET